MYLKQSVCALAVAATVMTAAWAQQVPATPRPQGGTGMSGDATSSNVDRAFVAMAISHARLSREVSEYVASKATNAGVKKLAQEISSEQQELSDKVQAAATKQGITLNPHQLLPRDQAVLDFMKELPVAAMERSYVFHLAGELRTHQLMAEWVAKNAEKPETKQVAQEIATKLETREKTIASLVQAQVNTPRTASER
jgi:predicted outer membrane protein